MSVMLLNKLPKEVRDIIREYASGHSLKLSIEPEGSINSDKLLYTISIFYGPVIFHYYHVDYITFHNNTISVWERGSKFVEYITLYDSALVVSKNFRIILDCDQMKDECNKFINRCLQLISELQTRKIGDQW